MKYKALLIFVLFIAIFCIGCSSQTALEKNTSAYDTAYHAEKDVVVSLGESVEAVNKKFSEDEYDHVDVPPEYDYDYRYDFREDDDMVFSLLFRDDIVFGFWMTPYSWAYGGENPLQNAHADCDWYFKGAISAQMAKGTVDAAYGRPTIEHGDERGTYDCTYHFDDAFQLLSEEAYETSSYESAYGAGMMFYEDQLIVFTLNGAE